MPFRYKIDVLAALRDAGYSTYSIRKNRLLGEGTLTAIRRGDMISLQSLDVICGLLGVHPWDVVEYHAHAEDEDKP